MQTTTNEIAIFFTQTGETPYLKFLEHPSLGVVVLGLGLLSAIGLGSYILASRYLPLIIFGLLGYLEPVLLAKSHAQHQILPEILREIV